MQNRYTMLCEVLPPPLKTILWQMPNVLQQKVSEIRLRVDCPLSVFDGQMSLFLDRQGHLCSPGDAYLITEDLLQKTVAALCGYSLHSHAEELQQGYLTAAGGCRVGICREPGIDAVSAKVTSVNIRIAREVRGAAKEIWPIWQQCCGMILAGPPACGKTTVLRDLIRRIASGENAILPLKAAVIDEREELSGLWQGRPSFDLGFCCDVIAGLQKADAIPRAVRTLSPQVILCDEIASEEEVQKIRYAFFCGVRFVVTVHCGGEEDVRSNPILQALMQSGAFSHLVLLQNPRSGSVVKAVITKDEYDC